MKRDIVLAALTGIGLFMAVICARGLAFSWRECAFIAGVVMMAVGSTNFGRTIIDEAFEGDGEWELSEEA